MSTLGPIINYDYVLNVCTKLDTLFNRKDADIGCLASKVIIKMNLSGLKELSDLIKNDLSRVPNQLLLLKKTSAKPWLIVNFM